MTVTIGQLEKFTPDQAAAWAAYVSDTAVARDRYVQTLDDASDRYAAVKALAEANAAATVRDAWEQREHAMAEAWLTYDSETKTARAARDWSLSQTQRLEIEP